MNEEAPQNAPEGSDTIWFLNSLVQIRIAASEDTDGISVLEHTVPQGDSPPLHLHRDEIEMFQILEGDFRFRLEDSEEVAGPGAILLVPKGVVHTYRAESVGGGRFITVTRGGGFEKFVRTAGRSAERMELPPRSGPPTPEQLEGFVALADAFGIAIVGPPLE